MSRKTYYGLFIIIAFNIMLVSSIFTPNSPTNQVIANDPLNTFTSSGVNVTNPVDLSLSGLDPTNQTISWALTDTAPKDYFGVYSFTNQTTGLNPNGWVINEPVGSDVAVIAEKSSHQKVVSLQYNTVGPTATQIFGNKAPSSGYTIEYWVYGEKGSLLYADVEDTGPGFGNFIWLQFRFFENKLVNVYNGGSNTEILSNALTEETWHHIRIRPTSTTSYQIWLDGILLGPVSGVMFSKTQYSRIYFCNAQNKTVYFDAIDYSWASGYYLNRNMNCTPPVLKDYLGKYSFTNVLNDATPSDWTFTKPAGSDIRIITVQESHRKVINLTRYTTDSYATQIFGSRSSSAGDYLEFWVYGENGTRMDVDIQNTGFGIGSYIWLQLRFYEQKLYSITMEGSSSNLLSSNFMGETWHHFRVRPTGSSMFELWLDGIQITNITDVFQHKTTYTRVVFQTAAFAGSVYVDAFDYSWDTGYSTNRNMNYSVASLVSAVFQDEMQKTAWFRWINKAQVDYKVNGLTLESGIHNISLSYNDTNGQWFHDDVQVTVLGAPNILEVLQNPVAPLNYQDVNITARVSDNTQVQNVKIQSNHTGTVANYTMTLWSGSPQNGIWNYTMKGYQLNKIISYRIFAIDSSNHVNSSGQFSFGVFDNTYPSILSVIQTPATLTIKQPVNVRARVVDNVAVKAVRIESNVTETWSYQNMTLLTGSPQDGIWDFTFLTYPINHTIFYRIVAIDVADRTNLTGFYTFGIFPIVSWDVPLALEFDIDIGIAGNAQGNIIFNFKNTGNTKLLHINFTIALPSGWTAKVYTISVNQLLPGETVKITFQITVPKDRGEFLEHVLISFDATVYELGQKQSGTIQTVVAGIRVWDTYIWLIVIVGSVAAVGGTSFYVIRTRRSSPPVKLQMKVKPKSVTTLRATIARVFPDTYTTAPIAVMEKINNMKDLTDSDREILLEYIAQLDEEEALAYLETLEKIKPD